MMPLLLDEDYESLQEMGLAYEEGASNHFFIFKNYPLPVGLYTVPRCDVLVVIPENYNQAGNDMFWTNPYLTRADGVAIPNTHPLGHPQTNMVYQGVEYCRWSRHWFDDTPQAWRPNKDDIISIQHRIDWALRNPNT